MWNEGLKKHLQEILEAFMGETGLRWNQEGTHYEFGVKLIMKDGVDPKSKETIAIPNFRFMLKEEPSSSKTISMYTETFTGEQLYELLVPKNSLEYLYLLQDLIREMKEEDSKERVVAQYHHELFKKMVPVFAQRRAQQEAAASQKQVEEVIAEVVSMAKPVDVIKPKRATETIASHFEQMAMF